MNNPRYFWQRSLVARLVLHYLLLSFVTVALLGSITYFGATRALRDAVFGRLEVEATLKADALDQWIEEGQREFELFAELSVIPRQFSALLELDPEGPEFQRLHGEISRNVKTFIERKPEWRELLLLSPKGQVLFTTEEERDNDYRSQDSYFVEGSKGSYIGKVYAAVPSYTPTITLARPVGPSEAPGVLALHLDLTRLDRILESTALGEDGESYLVDSVNVLVSGQRFGNEEYRRGVHSDGIHAAIAGQDGSGVYTSHRGVEVLGVYRHLDTLGAALMVEIPQEVALASVRRLLAVIIGVGLGVALVLAAGTFILAGQIARPILAVRDAAVQVTEGNLAAKAQVTTGDEIGTLARAFNQMTERTGHLIEELEARNEELGRFTYTVSHDLKSPLVTIQGFLGFLEKDIAKGDTPRIENDMGRISAAVQRMQRLLDELLELSRIGRMMNAPEAVDLPLLLDEVLAALEGPLGQRGVEVDASQVRGVVHGDRVRIAEVFQNLIENATRFMGDRAKPRIEVGAEQRADVVLCHVRDNGIGIDPRYHEKVFGLFERLDATTEGTGIGLALVKGIVEAHDGNIWIESEGRGHGTTFFFTLPRPPVT